MNRERWDDWCEKGILALVLAILVFGPLALGAVRPWQWLTIEGLTLGVMALWGLRLWLNPRPRLLWTPVCWGVLAFVAFAALRYFQAEVEYAARQEVLRVLVYAVLFFAILNNLYRQESTQVLALTPVFLAAAISIYACWQFATRSELVWNLHSPYGGRGSGTFFYPNSLALFLEMLAPVALGFALVGRLSHLLKILAGYAGLMMLAGIVATCSRGGMVVTPVVLGVLCVALLSQRDYRWHGLALAFTLGVAGLLVLPKEQATQRVLRSAETRGGPDDVRLSIWRAGLDIWREHPWLGVGPAQFDSHFRPYRPAKVQEDPQRLHSDLLTALVDWGLAGTALVAAAWVLLSWGVARSWKFLHGPQNDFARKRSNKLALTIGASAGLLAVLLHSAVDLNLHVPAVAIMMVALMALLSSLSRFATERYWVGVGPGRRWLATLALLAGAGLLAFTGVRLGREDHWLRQAAGAADYSVAQQAAFQRAFAVEPMNADTAWRIAECLRTRSLLNASADPDTLARQAIDWYRRGIKLDPGNPDNWTGCGACLDWINAGDAASVAEAARDFDQADSLDPNGYFTASLIGRHYFHLGDAAAARSWLERSLRLQGKDNELTAEYLTQAQAWLEAAALRQKSADLPASGGLRNGR
jgi:O-antigen ligase